MFKRPVSATLLNYLIINRTNVGQEVDNLYFRTDLTEGLLVKYYTQHKIPSCHGDDKPVKKSVTEQHFHGTCCLSLNPEDAGSRFLGKNMSTKLHGTIFQRTII